MVIKIPIFDKQPTSMNDINITQKKQSYNIQIFLNCLIMSNKIKAMYNLTASAKSSSRVECTITCVCSLCPCCLHLNCWYVIFSKDSLLFVKYFTLLPWNWWMGMISTMVPIPPDFSTKIKCTGSNEKVERAKENFGLL